MQKRPERKKAPRMVKKTHPKNPRKSGGRSLKKRRQKENLQNPKRNDVGGLLLKTSLGMQNPRSPEKARKRKQPKGRPPQAQLRWLQPVQRLLSLRLPISWVPLQTHNQEHCSTFGRVSQMNFSKVFFHNFWKPTCHFGIIGHLSTTQISCCLCHPWLIPSQCLLKPRVETPKCQTKTSQIKISCPTRCNCQPNLH